MIIHEVKVEGRQASCLSSLVQANVGLDQIKVTFSDEWAGYDRYACFFRNGETIVTKAFTMGDPTVIDIPWEVLEDDGYMYLSFSAYKGETEHLATAMMARPPRVRKAGDTEGDPERTPTPDAVQLVLTQCTLATAQALAAAEFFPSGGTEGQTLVKAGADDYQTSWKSLTADDVGAASYEDLFQEGQTRMQADELIMEDLETKVTKVAAQSGNPFVYGRMSIEDGGTEGKFTMSVDPLAGVVVKRNGSGAIMGRANPSLDGELIRKDYADLASQKVKKEHTTVNGKCAVLLKENATTAVSTSQTYFDADVTVNPSTGQLDAKSLSESGVLLSSKYVAKNELADLVRQIMAEG